MKALLIGIIFLLIIINTILFINGLKFLKVKGLTEEELSKNSAEGKKYFMYTSIFSVITIIIVTASLIAYLKM